MFSAVINELIDALRCLPGVGAKTAQRMALHILERDTHGGKRLADAIANAIEKVGHCDSCRTLTEQKTCAICSDQRRDAAQLCIVETPADMFAIEQSGSYRGRYFVLMGHLSPIDGIGPDEIGMPQLDRLLRQGGVEEMILATNLTVEGEATAYYISQHARELSIRVSRIAQGVPMGSELESIDGNTLLHAFSSRKPF